MDAKEFLLSHLPNRTVISERQLNYEAERYVRRQMARSLTVEEELDGVVVLTMLSGDAKHFGLIP